LLALIGRAPAEAHSASDAYLDLRVPESARTGGASADGASAGRIVLQGQWDIALRDLDFVLKLDDDGDGRLTWGEVQRHAAAIERYAFAHLRFKEEAGHACKVVPTRRMIDAHADGAYDALFFEVRCARRPATLTLDYSIFFAIDPSHRGILVMHNGDEASTAVLSPQHAEIPVTLGIGRRDPVTPASPES
jgi:hypothetical protein